MTKQAYITWSKYEEEDCFLIEGLWVPVEERGQGKGRKLLQDAIAEMRADGTYGLIKLSADSDSMDPENPIDAADLVEFYESEGFDLTYAGEIIVMEMSI